MTTEDALRNWRFGQTQAERLAAGILSIEGFRSVDPQHPLGGPDGIKDVICKRGIVRFVAAVYFPPTGSSFSDIKKKFQSDLLGVTSNAVNGFVFIVNQPVSLAQRTELRTLCEGVAEAVEIYHLERIRAVLDAPNGCGLRLEYLRIPMTPEEQIAYWSSANLDVGGRLDRIEQLQLRTLHQLEAGNEALLSRTTAIELNLTSRPSSTSVPNNNSLSAMLAGQATSNIAVPHLLWLHRIVMGAEHDLPGSLLGVLRTINVTVESHVPGSPIFVPPAPEELPGLLSDWCASWRDHYDEISLQDPDRKLDRICQAYYDFMRIHPFTDGNGRMGRALLDQMLRELLGRTLAPSFMKARLELQQALDESNQEDFCSLRRIVEASLL